MRQEEEREGFNVRDRENCVKSIETKERGAMFCLVYSKHKLIVDPIKMILQVFPGWFLRETMLR